MGGSVHSRWLGLALAGVGLALSWPGLAATLPANDGAQADARRRWESYSEERKQQLRQRYDELQKLEPEQRRELERRSRLLRRQREQARMRLPVELQRKLEGLEPERRRQVIKEFLRTEMQRRGGRIRDKLPQDWVERLESAEPAERRRMMRTLREQLFRENAPRAIGRLARELGLDRAQLRELEQLPMAERRDRLLELRRIDIEAKIERRGLPQTITPAEWDEWRELPAVEFFERWHERAPFAPPARPQLSPATARAVRQAFQPDPQWRREWRDVPMHERRTKLEQRLMERALAALESSGELGPEPLSKLRTLDYAQLRAVLQERVAGRLPGPAPRGAIAGRGRPSSLAPATATALRKAIRFDPQWVVEFGHLPAHERAQRMSERHREGVLRVLEAAPEVDSADLERLRSLSGREFREAVRRLAGS